MRGAHLLGPAPPPVGRRLRWRRASVVAATATGLALGFASAPAPAPASATDLGWTVTVDPPPAVVGSRPVVVAGRAAAPPLVTLTGVRVRLVSRVGLPDRCGAPPEEVVTPAGGRYRAELRPACNGPYRVEVSARGRGLLGAVDSGSPATRPVALADPGAAPPAPRVSSGPSGVTVTWNPDLGPDIVGWTLTRVGGGARDLPAATSSVTEPLGPGEHGYRLRARRWGAQGPSGPQVASAESAVATATVSGPSVAPPARPPSPDPIRPRATPPTTTDRPPSSDRGSGSRPRRTVPRRTPDSPRGGGYRDDLPYAVPEGAYVPGASTSGSAGEAGSDETAVGTPGSRLVRSTERTAPGVAVPLATGGLMLVGALLLGRRWHRSRAGPS